jgi:hypothetical protein
LRSFLKPAVPESTALPGAVIAVQMFGDFPERFHPHCHVLCSDGCFFGRGGFRVAPKLHLKDLETLFRHKVLRMLLARGKINEDLIRMMGGWWHSGFNVYAGPRIHPRENRSLENLAAYLIRSSIEDPKVIRRIMEYLGLWLANVRPVPKAHSPPLQPVPFEALISQMPAASYLSIVLQVPRICTPFVSSDKSRGMRRTSCTLNDEG